MKEKIRKLLVLSRDAGATEAERDRALELAQKLMLKYNIETPRERTGGVDRGDRIHDLEKKYHHIIAQAIGVMYNARPLFHGKDFCFIGREPNVDAATMTVNFVCDQVDMLYKAGLPKGMSQPDRAKWRREFKNSAASKIYLRCQKLAEQLSTNDAAAQEAVGCTALVVQSQVVMLREEVDEFLDSIGATTGRASSLTVKNTRAGSAGYQAGDKVQINKGLDKVAPKQIGHSS